MAICPICNEAASESTVNLHLDKGCPKFRTKSKQLTFFTKEAGSKPATPEKSMGGNPPRGATVKDSPSSRSEESQSWPLESQSRSQDAQSRSNASSQCSPASQPRSRESQSHMSQSHEPLSPPTSSSPSHKRALDSGPAQTSQTAQSKSTQPAAKKLRLAPLAEQMRPQSSTEYVGQSHLMGPHGIFTEILRMPEAVLPSMVLWGPSGVGKTSLARVLARKTQAKFVELSAPSAGSQDVKRIMGDARKDWQLLKRRTILFLDEIHRFNRSQQDSLLSGVERGDVTLIGATTENPSFKLSGALLSRMRVFVLQPLAKDELRLIVERAVRGSAEEVPGEDAALRDDVVPHNDAADPAPAIPPAIVDLVVEAASATGDARQALNMLETVRHLPTGADPRLVLKHSMVYDQRGEYHYDLISAFHKSVRGSDADAALYYLARMLEGGEDPLYVSRRMMRIASEDVGLADDTCLPFTVAVHTSVQQVGMPECDVMLAHAAVKLARAAKSVDVYKALGSLRQQIRSDPAISGAPVPMHLRNAPTKLMEQHGYGHNYKYNPNYRGPVNQQYLPDGVEGKWLGGFQPHLDDT